MFPLFQIHLYISESIRNYFSIFFVWVALPVIMSNDIPLVMNQMVSYRIFDLGFDVNAFYTGGYHLFIYHKKNYQLHRFDLLYTAYKIEIANINYLTFHAINLFIRTQFNIQFLDYTRTIRTRQNVGNFLAI